MQLSEDEVMLGKDGLTPTTGVFIRRGTFGHGRTEMRMPCEDTVRHTEGRGPHEEIGVMPP